VYAGDWQGGQRSGFGIESASDHTFAGTWERGERGRFGVLTCRDFAYAGSFFESQPHGVGKETDAAGGVYLGQFLKGNRHGFGVWVNKAPLGGYSSRYEGMWSGDAQEGDGVMRYGTGSVYRGQWRNKRRHGYGVLTGSDGRVQLSGKWDKDDIHTRLGEHVLASPTFTFFVAVAATGTLLHSCRGLYCLHFTL
jgi:hypothetical protein